MLDHIRLLRVEDAAVVLDCSKRHVFSMIASGKLRAVKLSARATRIAATELERFVNSGGRPPRERA
ncbi:MAG: helix-turn-helix transcriptional regulator [Solirubrobacteraceae bacterium]